MAQRALAVGASLHRGRARVERRAARADLVRVRVRVRLRLRLRVRIRVRFRLRLRLRVRMTVAQLPSAQRVGAEAGQPGTAMHVAAVIPQLPSAQSTPTPHGAAAAMQLAAELVQVPSAQRTWLVGAHESNAVQSAMVATHCSLPSGPQ